MKKTLNETWKLEDEISNDEKVKLRVPSHFQQYPLQKRKVMVQHPTWTLQEQGQFYDVPKKSKNVDLAK